MNQLREELRSLERRARAIRTILAEYGTSEPELFVETDKRPSSEVTITKSGDSPKGPVPDLEGMPVRDAVVAALKFGPGPMTPKQIADWLEDHGHTYSGKTKFSNRVRCEVHTLSKKNKLMRGDDGRYTVWGSSGTS